MNLVIDIGNTRLKTGLFQNTQLLESRFFTDWNIDDLIAYGLETGAERIIFSSVKTLEREVLERLDDRFFCLALSHETPLPFQNEYHTPQTLGKDRLAAVAGAHALYPGEACLVIDCGTCIKYDLLTADERYPGGNISPGLQMRVQAMHRFTARLPEVDLEMPAYPIGQSTETALQNGALRGAVLEMEGFVALFRRREGNLNVILTGGDADFIKEHLNVDKMEVQGNLTLLGLNHILRFNTVR